MNSSSPLTLPIAGGIGAMVARLITGPWPVTLGDWIGMLSLGVLVAAGVWAVLYFLARRRRR